jgi:hypothetical protein
MHCSYQSRFNKLIHFLNRCRLRNFFHRIYLLSLYHLYIDLNISSFFRIIFLLTNLLHKIEMEFCGGLQKDLMEYYPYIYCFCGKIIPFLINISYLCCSLISIISISNHFGKNCRFQKWAICYFQNS